MKYTIEDQNGEMINTGVFKNCVKTEVEKAKAKYPNDQIFVSFYRPQDGQTGYLNPDGNHGITGKAW